ncbi:MAG: SDR family oxidoreductase [Halioglobus sp.]|nr:SDR family oxidoreductase [Halioglobus sp.]
MENYRDKVVVITGSAGGIGFALAQQFGADGAKVVLSDIDGERLHGAVEALREQGVQAGGFVCDVTRREDVEALAQHAIDGFGAVDVLVNNAGRGQAPAPLIDMDLDEFRRVLDVNLYGLLHGVQVFGRYFLQRGEPAAIYNLGSENSIYPCVPSYHAYVASKHAVLAITELLAEETPDFLEVALIMPGLVYSEMTRDVFRGMDTDAFARKVIEQLRAGEFYVVSHAYNRERLDERYRAIGAAYDKYAPRYAGDEEFDIRTLLARMS